MSKSVNFRSLIEVTLLIVICPPLIGAQSVLAELKAEHDPAKRSEMALNIADSAFDNARDFYVKGEIDKGDAQLEQMTTVLDECVVSLAEAHKAKFYKKAELKVAYLLRRMEGLMDDIDLPQRGWAEQSERIVEEIHDKILDGVMRK